MMPQSDDADSPDRRPEVVDGPQRRPDQKDKVARKLEDAIYGVICHNCRQRRVEQHVICSRCPIRFCGRCLRNRHGEDLALELRENVRWICPRCRGGCGPGCYRNCCNCGPCRKSQKLQPTGLLIPTAREAGFNNVHDYLVHLETGESPAAIANRKHGRGWTSIDSAPGMELVVVVCTEQGHNALALTEKRPTKKIRSKRFLKVNARWGSSTIPGYNEPDLHEGRLRVAGLHFSWEVGRKVKIRWPGFSTANQIFSREEILDVLNWETGRDLKSESPDPQTEDQVHSGDRAQEESEQEPQRKRKLKFKRISGGLHRQCVAALADAHTLPFAD